jgi:hypothetical protein
MRAYCLLIISFCICIISFAQDKATITVKLFKENFKEDTLLTPLLSTIDLRTKYRRVKEDTIRVLDAGKDLVRISDSSMAIPNLEPGIYFLQAHTKNYHLAMFSSVERLVVCTKCNATVQLKFHYIGIGERIAEDEDKIFNEVNGPGYCSVYWEVNRGFNTFLKSSYLDSVRRDFFAVINKREKKKIGRLSFTVQAFITAQKEIADITILPEAIAPALKKIIMKGFLNIQFNKPNAPYHINRIKYSYFKGEKITIRSSELFN